jgi:hypothetical protein
LRGFVGEEEVLVHFWIQGAGWGVGFGGELGGRWLIWLGKIFFGIWGTTLRLGDYGTECLIGWPGGPKYGFGRT